MNNITKIVMCLVFALVFVSFAQAQKAKTITGYLCGNSDGMNAGTMGLRVGTRIVLISHTFSVAPGDYSDMTKRQAQKYVRENTTKYFKVSLPFDKIGSEFVVRYEKRDAYGGGFYNWASSITYTGRTRKTSRCSVE